jgi:quinol monooxygenase YgiN
MKVIVGGTVRVPTENIERLRPHMLTMLAASRAEDGCETYSYGFDAKDEGLVRVFEVWRDRAAIEAHFTAPHMAPWRAAGAELGVFDRKLSLYEVASERAL